MRMKLVVGLGNPGVKYALTRHNVGFWVIDELSKRWQISVDKEKWQAEIGEGIIGNEKVILIKPLTYMNRSGESVRLELDWFKVDHDAVCVIYDDLDLPPGQIRLRYKGSSGGHNGMKSMMECLGTDQLKRIRIGIGRPVYPSVSSYVLSPFSAAEKEVMDEAVARSASAVQAWIDADFLDVMNRYNERK
jgi:peptidyl-tRNA hydrolase, PTH1 family